MLCSRGRIPVGAAPARQTDWCQRKTGIVDVPISHDALGELYAKRLRSKGGLAIANFNHTEVWEKPDVVTWSGGFSVHLIEVKTSRSDFRRDFDKPWRQTNETFAEREKRNLDKAWARYEAYLVEHAARQIERQRQSDEFCDARGLPRTILTPYKPYDFHWSFDRRVLGMGKYRSYLCPAGLITKEDLPERWGLVWYDPTKTRGQFSMKRHPVAFPDDEINHHAGVGYLLKILERLVVNVENFQEAAQWGRNGRFVSGRIA